MTVEKFLHIVGAGHSRENLATFSARTSPTSTSKANMLLVQLFHRIFASRATQGFPAARSRGRAARGRTARGRAARSSPVSRDGQSHAVE
jgi:hypothetical protein